MLVNVTTDNYVRGSEGLREHIATVLEDALEQYGDRVTRVEVSLTDENSDKKQAADDLRCFFEARLAGFPPVTVSCQAPSMDVAIDGAVEKLLHALEHRIGKHDHKKGRMPMGGVDGLDGDPSIG
jgi:ribosome-associated translation inhibitor RaiA